MLKKKKLIYIGVAIIIIGVIIALFIKRGKSLSIENPKIKEVYTYLGNNDLEVCKGLITYSDKEVSIKDIDNSTKICMAYSLIDNDKISEVKIDKSKKDNTCKVKDKIVFATDNYEDDICTISKIDIAEINKKYEAIYGAKIESYDSFQLDNATICYYSEEDEKYYCGLSETYTAIIGAEPHTYRSISSVKKNNDELIIYDYFLKTINKECYTSYVGKEKNDKCTKNYKEYINYKFLKQYGSKYKHTYKKDGDSYHWVKSEPVK